MMLYEMFWVISQFFMLEVVFSVLCIFPVPVLCVAVYEQSCLSTLKKRPTFNSLFLNNHNLCCLVIQIKNNKRYAGASNWTVQVHCFLSLLWASLWFLFKEGLLVAACSQMELLHHIQTAGCFFSNRGSPYFYLQNVPYLKEYWGEMGNLPQIWTYKWLRWPSSFYICSEHAAFLKSLPTPQLSPTWVIFR
jgi:hypothetical protein